MRIGNDSYIVGGLNYVMNKIIGCASSYYFIYTKRPCRKILQRKNWAGMKVSSQSIAVSTHCISFTLHVSWVLSPHPGLNS